MKLELISFKLCPYVQRSVITLHEKAVPFDIKYIDLIKPPPWFLQISPMGKVPVLRVDETVLFESAVINEYLDEIHPPSLMPSAPLKKAQNRAWIEFASNLLVVIYKAVLSKDEPAFKDGIENITKEFKQLETTVGDGPYFNGDNFSLVDTAFAPAFKHLSVLESIVTLKLYDEFPNIARWKNQLLKRKSVQASVVADFQTLYYDYLTANEVYLAQQIK